MRKMIAKGLAALLCLGCLIVPSPAGAEKQLDEPPDQHDEPGDIHEGAGISANDILFDVGGVYDLWFPGKIRPVERENPGFYAFTMRARTLKPPLRLGKVGLFHFPRLEFSSNFLTNPGEEAEDREVVWDWQSDDGLVYTKAAAHFEPFSYGSFIKGESYGLLLGWDYAAYTGRASGRRDLAYAPHSGNPESFAEGDEIALAVENHVLTAGFHTTNRKDDWFAGSGPAERFFKTLSPFIFPIGLIKGNPTQSIARSFFGIRHAAHRRPYNQAGALYCTRFTNLGWIFSNHYWVGGSRQGDWFAENESIVEQGFASNNLDFNENLRMVDRFDTSDSHSEFRWVWSYQLGYFFVDHWYLALRTELDYRYFHVQTYDEFVWNPDSMIPWSFGKEADRVMHRDFFWGFLLHLGGTF